MDQLHDWCRLPVFSLTRCSADLFSVRLLDRHGRLHAGHCETNVPGKKKRPRPRY